MSKSTITRERLLEIIVTGPEASGAEQNALARMALAAMDSEPVEMPLDYLQGHKDGLEWAAQLAEANHPETGDWLYDDPIELAKAIRKGPDMPPAQPALDTETVAYTDERNLGYIDRGRETAYLWGKQNSEASDVALYRHAQPTPVVSGWIPVSERMPEMGEKQRYVLAADFKNNYWPNIPNTQVGVYGDWFDDGNPTWDDGDGEDLHLKEVTHWMPLPAAPQGVIHG